MAELRKAAAAVVSAAAAVAALGIAADPAAAAPAVDGGIYVYKDYGHVGPYGWFDRTHGDLTQAHFTDGSNMNDAISTIRNPSNSMWCLFADADFRGRSEILYIGETWSADHHDFNDQISSFYTVNRAGECPGWG
jgi:hypothetical protein